jgi:hypothetical protein
MSMRAEALPLVFMMAEVGDVVVMTAVLVVTVMLNE